MFVTYQDSQTFNSKDMITALTVNYNTPELLEIVLSSFRQFYDIPYVVVDGSDKEHYKAIVPFADKYDIKIHHFDYNIHHGPGMGWGILHIETEQILLLDSDIRVLNHGFVEDMQSKLLPENYGIGDVSIVNEDGINVEQGIKYLHPSCALINREVALRYPMPIKHGAPMIETMKYLHKKGYDILQHESWVANDLVHSFYDRENIKNKVYINHEWRGTVDRTGGYHL
jgi:hypothetical protein